MTRCLILLVLAAALAVSALAPTVASADTASFRNSAEITIPQQGTASSYPSTVGVRNLRGPVADVQVTLNGVSHTRPEDLDVLLVAPDGSSVVLMSDNCGQGDVVNRTWTFHSNGGLPDMGNAECPYADYADSDWGAGDTWPGVTSSPFASLDAWHRKIQTGAWKLYVVDDEAGDSGTIARGWSLSLTTGPVDMLIPAEGASGPASPYPATVAIAGAPGEIVTDLDVDLGAAVHDRADDLDLLLVGPRGQATILMSDACGQLILENPLGFDDEARFFMPIEASPLCNGFVRPTEYDPGDAFPAPAPAGPYPTSLSEFDYTDPTGEWKLYAVDDDESAQDGYFLERFKLAIKTRPRAAVAFADQAIQLDEGTTRALTIRRSADGGLGEASVTLSPVPGSAGADDFVTPASTVVRFGRDEREKTIEIGARSDGPGEPAESFTVMLVDPTGDAVLGAQPSTAITIPASAGPADPQSNVKRLCADRPATIVGTAAPDVLRGTRSADVIAALGGNDRVEGLRGNDVVCGGAGRDRLLGGRGRDRLIGGRGRDICFGGPGSDRISCP